MYVLGIDPGKSTGLALIQVDGKTILPVVTEVSRDLTTSDYAHLLERADILVVENFRVRPNKARQGSFDWDPMVTTQVIGALQLQARQKNKILVLQEPAVKPVGYGWSNMKYQVGRKGMHWQDALAHAVYYAVKNLAANPVTPS